LYRGVGGVIKSGFTEFRWIPRLSVFHHLLLGLFNFKQRVTSRRCKHPPEVLLFSMQVLFLERFLRQFKTSLHRAIGLLDEPKRGLSSNSTSRFEMVTIFCFKN
jgi:hypothetical protein